MRISLTTGLCESTGVNPMQFGPWSRTVAVRVCWVMGFALLLMGVSASVAAASANAPATNAPVVAPAAAPKLDEAAFRLIAERNIFNAERSGGRVVLPTSRPRRVESFTLVGTMAYEKGVFAFFESSNSEYARVVKAGGVIAGHKIADVLANAVKLEADGKIVELPLGAAMRREDEGTWHLGEAISTSNGSAYASNRSNDDRSSRSSRGDRDRNDDSRSRRSDNDSERGNSPDSNRSSAAPAVPGADQSEILKRLMERRERESQ